MDIVVTLKEVPDPNIPPSYLEVDESGTHIGSPYGIPSVMNGYDANALEEALRLREAHGGSVAVVSQGGGTNSEALRRALAMGADSVVMLSDPAWQDCDSAATAEILAAAIRKHGMPDLVLCGRQASDTDAGQVLHCIAEMLGLPLLSPVSRIEEVSDGSLTAHRLIENGYQRVRIQLPALLGISSEINEPRYPPAKGLMMSKRALIPIWSAAELDVRPGARRVRLRQFRIQQQNSQADLIPGDSGAARGTALSEKLHEVGVI